VSDFYAQAGVQVIGAGVVLELLMGALILRWGVAWRNRMSDRPIRAPELGKAIGVVGLSLLLAAPAAVGLVGTLFVVAASTIDSAHELREGVWLLAWVFLPLACVGFFVLRAGIVCWIMRTDFDDALTIQVCEVLIHVLVALLLGLAALIIVLGTK
jgi:hypothetical protein